MEIGLGDNYSKLNRLLNQQLIESCDTGNQNTLERKEMCCRVR